MVFFAAEKTSFKRPAMPRIKKYRSVYIVNRRAPFKAFKAGAPFKDQNYFIVARDRRVTCMGVRGETLWPFRARLHGDLPTTSISTVKGHGPAVVQSSRFKGSILRAASGRLSSP